MTFFFRETNVHLFSPQNYASVEAKSEELQLSNNILQEKIQQFTETNKQYGIQKQQLEAAHRKVATLEEEIVSFGEWKKLYKVRGCRNQHFKRHDY